jgi:L-threonylcarbamoyladenylate synthase
MPGHPLFRRLLKLTALPLAAPSANPFGYISPTTAGHVQASLGKKISYILDGGPCSIGVESTIVDLRKPDAPKILRPGAVTREQLEDVLGIPVRTARRRTPSGAQVAPGLLKRHYSPRTPATLHSELSLQSAAKSSDREAWIFIARPPGITGKNIFWLEARGQLNGAARRLFDVLRNVDAAGFKHIHLERASGGGLAEAINDRLERASAR